MGFSSFFKSLTTAAVGAAGGFLTGGPAGAVAGAVGAVTATNILTPTTAVGGGVQRGTQLAGETATQAIRRRVAAGGEPLIQAAIARGAVVPRLKNMVRTLVQTIAPDGTIIREVILEGRPFLMRKDFVTLKRTLKLISAAEKRIPRARRRGQKDRDELNELQGLVRGLIAGDNPTARALTVIDTD